MFRFTIRDVLWLTVVAAMAVGWWIDHGHVPNMTWQWREMHEEGLFTKDVEFVTIEYWDGSETNYSGMRGIRHVKDADP
jgi:hypothetical protein